MKRELTPIGLLPSPALTRVVGTELLESSLCFPESTLAGSRCQKSGLDQAPMLLGQRSMSSMLTSTAAPGSVSVFNLYLIGKLFRGLGLSDFSNTLPSLLRNLKKLTVI